MLTYRLLSRALILGVIVLIGMENRLFAQSDAERGKTYFETNCALCHSVTPGAVGQGPSLAGVFGRRAAVGSGYTYTKALSDSQLTWDAPSLDRFLANPAATVPGTTMPIAVAKETDRRDLTAYLMTLSTPVVTASPTPTASPTVAAAAAASSGSVFAASDWRNAAPGLRHHLTVENLPKPYRTTSAGNGPHVVKAPEGAAVSVPAGFAVKQYASGLSNPRLIRTAPNGDLFLAETSPRRLRVLRAPDGADAPSANEIFADGLDQPFGIAFYPPGNDPRWVYVANNNSVVRFAYHNGDLKATGSAEVIVPHLTDSGGGHSTRDVAFSLDGKRMFISVGSGSNDAEHMSKKSVDDLARWELDHGLGAAWDGETNRADILVTDPEGHAPLRTFASGIRNGVGIAVNPTTGDLWTSTNERDGLGDDLVPDYLSRVKEGGFYGWPWFYLGDHEDPRHPGERPDLAARITVPDVLVQAHSASLEMTFYPPNNGSSAFPPEYHGDIFAAFHGSWNRNTRTGYKVVRVFLKNGVPTGEYEDFLTGFVADDRSAWGRPVGVTVAHDGALLVSEDGNGTIWRVTPTTTGKASTTQSAP